MSTFGSIMTRRSGICYDDGCCCSEIPCLIGTRRCRRARVAARGGDENDDDNDVDLVSLHCLRRMQIEENSRADNGKGSTTWPCCCCCCCRRRLWNRSRIRLLMNNQLRCRTVRAFPTAYIIIRRASFFFWLVLSGIDLGSAFSSSTSPPPATSISMTTWLSSSAAKPLPLSSSSKLATRSSRTTRRPARKKTTTTTPRAADDQLERCDDGDGSSLMDCLDRRRALKTLTAASLAVALLVPPPSGAVAAAATKSTVATAKDPLEQVLLGTGQWTPLPPPPPPSSSSDSSSTVVDGYEQQQQSPNRRAATSAAASSSCSHLISPVFCAYLTRFVLLYDPGAAAWWTDQVEKKVALLPENRQKRDREKSFASLACSVHRAVESFLLARSSSCPRREDYERLWDVLVDRYGLENGAADSWSSSALRQMTLLFALVPNDKQPVSRIRQALSSLASSSSVAPATVSDLSSPGASFPDNRMTTLLPLETYRCVRVVGTDYYAIDPPLSSRWWENPLGRESTASTGFAASGPVLQKAGVFETPFGPVAFQPLQRDLPEYRMATYALLGMSGAAGCALTHVLVIPLDVIKTKKQVEPEVYAAPAATRGEAPPTSPPPSTTSSAFTKNVPAPWTSLFSTSSDEEARLANGTTNAFRILIEREGLSGLFSGAQATVAGYLWYGLSVYPCYALFKRILSGGPFLTTSVAALHANDIALVAGALAAVVASLGLTPIEAARIRAVADPRTYRPLGLLGTLDAIASEGYGGDESDADASQQKGRREPSVGLKALYAGLPSLLARQVIFGSVKFLAFELACDWMYASWPSLRSATWTCLTVSLVAGGLSGVISSVVSQPADSVLTYVAQNRDGSATQLGLWDGCVRMVRTEGVGSLFRGLASRCVWAGSIIAGQFLLYDVFRTYLGVNDADLQQVYNLVINIKD